MSNLRLNRHKRAGGEELKTPTTTTKVGICEVLQSSQRHLYGASETITAVLLSTLGRIGSEQGDGQRVVRDSEGQVVSASNHMWMAKLAYGACMYAELRKAYKGTVVSCTSILHPAPAPAPAPANCILL
jgi:hypothetical protein